MSDDPVLNPKETAELLGVDRETVARLLRRGELAGAKHGNRWYIRQSAIDRFLEPTTPDAA